MGKKIEMQINESIFLFGAVRARFMRILKNTQILRFILSLDGKANTNNIEPPHYKQPFYSPDRKITLVLLFDAVRHFHLAVSRLTARPAETTLVALIF
jgi:hypothetical protein